MMEPKIVKFTYHPYYANGYVYKSDKESDVSGEYVPFEDWEALKKKLEDTENDNHSLREYVNIYVTRLASLEEENSRLNKMRVHCEKCGADYLQKGTEAGCPCELKKENERLKEIMSDYDEAKDCNILLRATRKSLEGMVENLQAENEKLQAELAKHNKYNHDFKYREELEFSNNENFILSWRALFTSIAIYPDGSYEYNSLIPDTDIYKSANYARRPVKEPEFSPQEGEPVLGYDDKEINAVLFLYHGELNGAHWVKFGPHYDAFTIGHIKPLPNYTYKKE